MDDFQRFHRKAFIWLAVSFVVLLLVCVAAAAAGQWWITLVLLPAGGFGMKTVYRVQCRRYDDRRDLSRHRDGSAHP